MSKHIVPDPEERAILLRAFAEPAKAAQKPTSSRRSARASLASSGWSLVFDCETSTDPGQALRFGFARVYFREELRREICFYRPGGLTKKELLLLNTHSTAARFEVMPCAEFIEKVFYEYAYHCRALVIGFNLPFDLSRLAIGHSAARPTRRDQSMYGGFSLKLSQAAWCPPVQVKHLSRYVSLIRFAGYQSPASRSQRKRGQQVPHKRGYFLEVRTLAAALFSKSFTLASLAEFLKVSAKLHTAEHGKELSTEYLDYARQDVGTTWECFLKLRARYDAMVLNTPINRIFSEASLGKAYFDKMGIKPWQSLQPNVPRSLLATIMSTFYGGRSEVKIRREMRQVVLCDFLSMYPTVCTLMGLWSFVIARGMRWRDGTVEVKRLLKSWTLADLQKKQNWTQLVGLVLVQPDADIFPVRAGYDSNDDGTIGHTDGTIGANYLSSKRGVWFTLADCLAAQILTGKSVKVVKAIVFRPLAPQAELREVSIAEGHQIDPYKHDLYKSLIELRQELKRSRDQARGSARDELDIQQNTVKIATNATSYGIFAEINVNDRPDKESSRIFGACDRPFLLSTNKEEQPGRYFHPLLATAITGAARLMLAITERLVTDAGLEWAFCDTDSMAIAKPRNLPAEEFNRHINKIVGWFRKLNPYNFEGDILKIEDVNYGLKDPKNPEPLFVWAVSAKRYVLFNNAKGIPVIRKASAHGLGHLYAPYGEDSVAREIPLPPDKLSKIGVHRWQYDLWWTVAKAAIDGKSDQDVKFDFHPALKQPATSRYAATTPKNLKWFQNYNSKRQYPDQVKPFGFVSALYARNFEGGAAIKPVAPFEKDPKRIARSAFDRITGMSVLSKQLKTYQEALAQYHLHPEDKFLNGNYLDHGTTERRHVLATEIQYIGKESNKWEEQFYFGFDPEEEIRYGARPVTRKSLARKVRKIVDTLGLRAAAKEFGICRGKLSKLLKNEFLDCEPEFMQRISGIVGRANSRLIQEQLRESELLKLAKREIREIGISAFASRIDIDPSNLTKAIQSVRNPSALIMHRLRCYFTNTEPGLAVTRLANH